MNSGEAETQSDDRGVTIVICGDDRRLEARQAGLAGARQPRKRESHEATCRDRRGELFVFGEHNWREESGE